MKLIGRVPDGIRIWRIEFYRFSGPLEFGRLKGFCGCIILSIGRIGITWLSKECMGYGAEDER